MDCDIVDADDLSGNKEDRMKVLVAVPLFALLLVLPPIEPMIPLLVASLC